MIVSKDNTLVKHINALKHKKDRKAHLQYLVEGIKIVDEAIKFNKDNIVNIVVSETYAKTNNISADYTIFSDEIFDYVTEHQTPEGILAIIKMKEEIKPDYTASFVIVLNEVQDPGNLGNIIRIADSLDLKQVIVSQNTVDPYMPKVVRSTMGSSFRVNTLEKDILQTIEELIKNGYEVYSAVLDKDAQSLYKITTKDKKIAVIFGNESKGINTDVSNKTKKLFIPMKGQVDSLNVASSVAIVSYEIFRQSLE